MAKKEEKLHVESLEEEVQELKRELFRVFESFIPPREVRQEIIRNLYTIELSVLKIFKTLIDYQVKSLEKKVAPNERGKKAKKIQVD